MTNNIKPLKRRTYYCTNCECTTINPEIKGHTWLEIVLWLLYILPGVVYSIWRRQGLPNVCPTCKAESLVAAATQTPPEKSVKEVVECPFCAEEILAKAKLCKHCRSEIGSVESIM